MSVNGEAPGRQVQIKTRAMGRITQIIPDGSQWEIKIYVMGEDDRGNESIVGEAVLRGLDFGPDCLKLVLAQVTQLAPSLIAMKTARIQPANVMPLVPPRGM